MASFDVNKAKMAGYSDEEIQAHMASRNLVPKFNLGDFAENVGKSAVGFGKNILSAPKNIYNLGKGLLTGQTTLGETGKGIGQGLKDRYGGLDELARTAYFDPVGSLADVSMGAGALGGVAKLGKFGEAANVLGKVSKSTDPFSVVGRGAKLATSPFKGLVGKTGKSLVSEGENLLTKGIGSPKQLGKVKGLTGKTSIDDLFRKYDLYDRTPEAFQEGANLAGKNVKEMLKSKPVSIGTRDILKMFDDEINKLAKQAKTSSKARLAMKELVNRKQMYLEGIQNPNVSTPLAVDASKAYQIKSDFQGDVPPSSFGMPSQDVGRNLGTTKAYRTLLQGIEQQAPGIRQTGREQAALIKLQQMAKDASNRSSSRQNLNFTKTGLAGVGAFAAGIPGAVAGFATERIANSPKYLSSVSKGLTKTGKALQKPMPRIVNNSINKISPVVNKAYGIAKPVSRLMPTQRMSQSPVEPKKVQQVQTYKPTISPIAPKINNSALPTAESFYEGIKKKRGY